MTTIEEARQKATIEAVKAAKTKLETEGLTITADEYNRLGATYRLYAMCLSVMMTHNNLKTILNDAELSLINN